MSTVAKREPVKPGAQTEPVIRREPGDYHHGKSPAGWFGSMMVLFGFVFAAVGALLVALPGHESFGSVPMVLMIVGGVLVVVGLIGTLALRALGFGQDPFARN